MKKFAIGLAAIGAAGYFAYQHFADSDDGQPAGSGTAAATPPPSLKAAVLALVKSRNGSALLTHDQWNWFREQLTSTPGPSLESARPDADRGELLTVDQWWEGVELASLRGTLGGLA